jgi:hypothetical protein
MQQQFLFEAEQRSHFPVSQTFNDTIALYSSPMRRLADLGADALTEIDALSFAVGRLLPRCASAPWPAKDTLTQVHFDNPESFYKVFGPEMRAFDREVLAAVPLNTRFRLIKFEELSQGTGQRDFCAFIKPAIIHSAYAFHDHSGDRSAGTDP